MKVVLTLLVRDEVDIIESNLNYHLNAGVDFILVTDNGSVDGTTAILKQYVQTGRLAYFYQAPADFSQHAWVTHMARRAYSDYHADWVINGDADEFFVARRGSLKEALQHVPGAVNMIFVQRHDFVPFNRTGGHPPPVAMIFRKQRSLNLRAEPLPPKVIHRGVADVTISQGNHEAGSGCFQDPGTSFPAIEVFHYPIRSFKQFETKVRNGGSGYAVNEHLDPDIGFHKRYWYRRLLEGTLHDEYKRHFYPPGRLFEALVAGELVADRTLSDALQQQQPDAYRVPYRCPFCMADIEAFLPFGKAYRVLEEKRVVGGGYRPHAQCPVCRSLDRERLLYLYLLEKTDLFEHPRRLLHIAPEPRLKPIFQMTSTLEYITADLDREDVMVTMDITKIPFPDHSFDAIICNHVLEHIVEDRKAMGELYRVLKPGGWAIVQVPFSLVLDHTYEDFSITTDAGREEAFGQANHVRIYASDYQQRLEQAGFVVDIFHWLREPAFFGGRENRYGLIDEERIYLAAKPELVFHPATPDT